VTIRLVVDPVSRKKNVVIDYEADSGALPIEHEEEHRKLVDKLIEGGIVKAGELGKIVVERKVEKAPGAAERQGEAHGGREATKQKG
jgi:hypothetical protein